MKKISRQLAALSLGFAALLTVACDDNDDTSGPGKQFTSELIGSYTPATVGVPNDPQDPNSTINQQYLWIDATWNDPQHIPTVDMSFMLGLPPGSYPAPISMALTVVDGIVSNFIKSGLVGLELKNDGSFGAQYRTPIFTGDLLKDLLKGTAFSDEIFTFPNAETEQLIPAGALTYYTEDGKLYLSVSKAFLTAIAPQMELPDMIDQIITANNLTGIMSTKEAYAIPFKYSIDGTMVTLYVDKAMMAPFVPVIKSLLVLLPDADQTGGIDLKTFVPELLDKLFDNTSELKIKFFLERK